MASLEAGSLVVKAVAVDPVEPKREDRVADTPVEKEVVPTGATRKVTLPTLPRFVGDRSEDGAFEHWTKKLLRHAELEKWTEQEKLLQLELHLSGRAKQLYEVLPTEEKASFEKAVEALGHRLQPVKSEALLSAQLMCRKQWPTESVNEYAHDFEALFEKSYGRRVGMDEPSKVMLKCDLFVQGLLLKWQEKVVPSATTFGDALHRAGLAEEHDRQITEIHRGRVDKSQPKKKAPVGNTEEPVPDPVPKTPGKGCFRCGSQRHRARECPQRRPPSETPGKPATRLLVIASGSSESLDAKCARLHEELAVAEHQRLLSSYVASALYYAKVEAEGTMVSAMIDPGSSATIVSFEQLKEIGRCAGISVKALKLPDLVLRDYNQQPIPVGAKVELTFRWKGKEVTTPTYIRAECSRGEPCLLGTNVVIPLGMMVPDSGVEARGGQDVPGVAAGVGARVHLVDSVRVPVGLQ